MSEGLGYIDQLLISYVVLSPHSSQSHHSAPPLYPSYLL